MQYRIVTTDEFILGYGKNRKEANALAEQQAKCLQETIIIKHRVDGEYEEIAQVQA